MDDDPFDPAADPYAPARLSRRSVLLAIAVTPAVAAVAGCVPHRLGCATEPTAPSHCRHRFCRYHG